LNTLEVKTGSVDLVPTCFQSQKFLKGVSPEAEMNDWQKYHCPKSRDKRASSFRRFKGFLEQNEHDVR
jgi:hypothetical protein